MFYTIYRTTNKVNNKIYIGKHQTNNLDDNYLGSGKMLQRAIKKYGKENFTKEVLFVFETEAEMNTKEKELITEDFCKEINNYNIAPGGQGGGIRKGMKHSDETKRLFSIQRIGNKNWYRKGFNLTEEHKNKIGKAHKGKKHTEEHKNNLSKARKGMKYNRIKQYSEETKRRMSESKKGKPMPKTLCVHCDKLIGGGNYQRWHGDNCKSRITV